MENNLKDKTSFFLKYHNQTVFCTPLLGKQTWAYTLDNFSEIDHDDYLLLKSLKELTEHDAIEVAKIICARHNRHFKADDISYKIKENGRKNLDIILLIKSAPKYIVQITNDGFGFIDYYLGGSGEYNYYCPGQYEAADFLIKNGYYTGNGKEIEFGWVKISEQ